MVEAKEPIQKNNSPEGSQKSVNLDLNSLVNTLTTELTEAVSDIFPQLDIKDSELENTLKKISESVKDNFSNIDVEALQNRADQEINEFGDKNISPQQNSKESAGQTNEIASNKIMPSESEAEENKKVQEMDIEGDNTEQNAAPNPKNSASPEKENPPEAGNFLKHERPAGDEQTKNTKGQKTSDEIPEDQTNAAQNSAAYGKELNLQNPDEGEQNQEKENMTNLQRERQTTEQGQTANSNQDGPENFDPNDFDVDDLITKHEQQSKNSLSGASKQKGGAMSATAGKKYGEKLDQAIKRGNFKAFYIALGLALLKDSWDLIDPVLSGGIIGSIVNIFISAVLYYIVYIAQYGWIKRYIMKTVHKKLLRSILIEFVPILGFLPMYTVLILTIRWQSGGKLKEIRKMRAKLDADTQSMEAAKNARDLATVYQRAQETNS